MAFSMAPLLAPAWRSRLPSSPARLRQLVGEVQELSQSVGHAHVAAGTGHLGQPLQRLAEAGTQAVDIDIGLGQQVAHGAAVLVEQRHHQVHRLDELVVAAERERLRVRQGHLELAGKFVHAHGLRPPGGQIR